jgi:hypothetical protein
MNYQQGGAHISLQRSARNKLAHISMMDGNWWTHSLHGYNTFPSLRGLSHLIEYFSDFMCVGGFPIESHIMSG